MTALMPGKLYKFIGDKEIYCFPDNGAASFPAKIEFGDVVLLISFANTGQKFIETKMKFVFLINNQIRRKHGDLDYFIGPTKIFELIP